MVAQDDGRGADAQVLHLAALQLGFHHRELAEKRLDELVKLLARWRQRERAALEQRHAQVFFQPRELAADGGLLDAVGHVAGRLGDAAMPGDVVEEFEMVDVHKHPRG